MKAHEQAVRQFSRHLAGLLLFKQALGFATAWLFIWGTTVLALRSALGTPRLPMLWGLAGLVPCIGIAWLAARRRVPALASVRALLDQQSRSGGLLMAGAEQPLGRWEASLAPVVIPQVRWHSRRAWLTLAAAVAFLVLAFLVPQRLAELGSGPRLEVGKDVEKLAEQIEVLKEEKILEPTRADDLEKQLDKVRDDALGRDPTKTLEALDHLENETKKSAREAAEEAGRKSEKLAQAQSLAEALQQAGDKLDPKLRAEVMAELSARAKKAEAEKDLDKLDPDLAEALDKGFLDEKDLAKLSDALNGSKGRLGKRLGRLAKAGLLDPDALKKCEMAGECKAKALAEYLKDCKSGC
jgi:hypothetical protein